MVAWPAWGSQAVAATGSVLAGVAAGVVTNVVTDRPSVPWAIGLGALVVVMIIAQVWLTVAGGAGRSGSRTGAGSVSVRGSSSALISTDVAGVRRVPGAARSTGDRTGSGSVDVGGDSHAPIRTRVRDVEEP